MYHYEILVHTSLNVVRENISFYYPNSIHYSLHPFNIGITKYFLKEISYKLIFFQENKIPCCKTIYNEV